MRERPRPLAASQDVFVLLVVISGPIASGKTTLGRAVARELAAVGNQAALVDLDLVYEMLDPSEGAKTDRGKWTRARRVAARLTDVLFAEGLAVIVEGEFLTARERHEFDEARETRVEPLFVTLRISFDLALQRVQLDPRRGLSRDPRFLRGHYEATAATVRNAPRGDLVLDTGRLGIAEAAGIVAEWALQRP